MRKVLAISRKELGGYFTSPVAYLVMAAFFALSGYFFLDIVTYVNTQSILASLRTQMGGGGAPVPIDVSSLVAESYFSVLATLLLFVLPMITMSLFAEERRRGTIELLFTSPLSNTQIVLGKYLGAFLFVLVLLLPSALYGWVLYFFADPMPSLWPLATPFLGALLLASVLVAFGLLISSFTDSDLVAAVVTFAVFLGWWALRTAGGDETGFWHSVTQYAAILSHFDDFVKGVLDTRHVVYYLSLTVLGLFFTAVSLDLRRLRP